MPLSHLNSEQYSAATAKSGNNLIIASAGTGKTSTIIGRIAHLLQGDIKPHEILLLTFTNKAAKEMLERISLYFSKEVANDIEAGTFHAVSYRWLKRLKVPVLLKQSNELKTLLKSVYEKRNFSYIDSDTGAFSAPYLYDIYSFYQNSALGVNFSDWIKKKHEEHLLFAEIYEDIVNEYEVLKKEYGFVNFNDLLILMREQFGSIEIPFKEVLIDEYQDTNPLQGSLIDAMQPSSLFCVGDYDQSIYGFNGSSIDIIGSFAKKQLDARVHTLNINYRSTASILELANRVITNNLRLYPKKLEVFRKTELANAPKLLVYDELFDQYQAIATRVKSSSCEHEDIAVIFRNNATADGIEATLREKHIACKRKGGNSFFDAKEVRALLDIYTILVNPKDLMAFIHIFEYAKGVGSLIAKEMFEALVKLGDGSLFDGLFNPKSSVKNLFEKRKHSVQLGLFEDIVELGSVARFSSLNIEERLLSNPVLRHPKLSTDGVEYLQGFFTLMGKLRKARVPRRAIELIRESDLFEKIVDSLSNKRAQLKDGTVDLKQKEEAKLRILRKAILLWELSKPYSEHERFVNAMILGANDLTQGEGVNLLTVHASKGLEFKEVYLIDLMDGRFPNRNLINKGGSVDEERRLFYVATTRAKDTLYLSYAKKDRVRKAQFTPSQFLYESGLIPKDEEYKKLIRLEENKRE